MEPAEASHSKFEVDSELELLQLLSGGDAFVKLFPSSFCHIQLGKEPEDWHDYNLANGQPS
jgi:hypothetical protein